MAEVNSVRKALAILDLLSDGKERTLSEIARQLSLAKSTAHGLLETLAAERLLEKDSGSNTFSLGIRLIELGYCAQTGLDLVRIAAPFLKGLNIRFDETVHLVVLDNDEVLYIAWIYQREDAVEVTIPEDEENRPHIRQFSLDASGKARMDAIVRIIK